MQQHFLLLILCTYPKFLVTSLARNPICCCVYLNKKKKEINEPRVCNSCLYQISKYPPHEFSWTFLHTLYLWENHTRK